jgi:hypothetical protein
MCDYKALQRASMEVATRSNSATLSTYLLNGGFNDRNDARHYGCLSAIAHGHRLGVNTFLVRESTYLYRATQSWSGLATSVRPHYQSKTRPGSASGALVLRGPKDLGQQRFRVVRGGLSEVVHRD